jgi:hypothetical protein
LNESWTGLAEAVNAVRQELIRARVLGAGSPMPFEVGPIEMEFEVALAKQGAGNAAVKVWVFEAGTSASLSNQRTHRLKVVLNPQHRDGGPAKIGRRPQEHPDTAADDPRT